MSKNSHNYFLKRTKRGVCTTRCQDILQNYMNLNNVVLAQIQRKKTMKQNRIQKETQIIKGIWYKKKML